MMMHHWMIAGAAAVLVAATAWAQEAAPELSATDLGDGIYMITDPQGRTGGNIGISVGPDGVFMIDDKFAPLTEPIEALIASVNDGVGAVRFIVNTHYHGDHTGGNDSWAGQGATVFAHDNARARMAEPPLSTFSGQPQAPQPEGGWPTVTYADGVSFHMNGETVRVRHIPNAHTDGDSVVTFEESNIVHMGDLFFNGFFPYIDTNAGGSVDGFIAAQQQILAEIDEDTVIIPGHGPLADKAALQRNVDVLIGVRANVQALIDEGKSLEDTLAAKPLQEYAPFGAFFISTDKMTEIVYDDLKD